MTSEISSVAASSAALASAQRGAALTGQLLNLLQPAAGALAPGQTARADVLQVRQGAQDFQVLLALTLDNGKTLNLQVSTSQPLAQGTQLLVQKLFSDQLAVTNPGAGSLTELDTRQVPPGTLLQGKVITSVALPADVAGGAMQYRATVALLGSALAGQSLTLDSPQPLRLGSLLSAVVQGPQALRFVQVGQQLDQLALSQQLNTQQSRQASLPSLLGLLQNAQAGGGLPPAVGKQAQALLASLPSPADLTDPRAVAQAFQASGLFMETRLLAGSLAAEQPAPDLKSALLRLVAQLLPNVPDGASINPATLAVIAQNLARAQQSNRLRNALGLLGQVSAKPEAGSDFPLPARNAEGQEGENDLHALLRLASAAISRLQTHQLTSLEHSGVQADGKILNTWQLEIPMRYLDGLIPLQVRVQSEAREGEEEETDAEGRPRPKRKLWRLELAFDLDPLGPLQVQVELLENQLTSQLWAENPRTAALIEQQLGYLRQRLSDAGLEVGELNCHTGKPARGPRTQLDQRWVDETA